MEPLWFFRITGYKTAPSPPLLRESDWGDEAIYNVSVFAILYCTGFMACEGVCPGLIK